MSELVTNYYCDVRRSIMNQIMDYEQSQYVLFGSILHIMDFIPKPTLCRVYKQMIRIKIREIKRIKLTIIILFYLFQINKTSITIAIYTFVYNEKKSRMLC